MNNVNNLVHGQWPSLPLVLWEKNRMFHNLAYKVQTHTRIIKDIALETGSIISTWRSASESSGVEMKYRLGINVMGLRVGAEQSKAPPQHCIQPAQNHSRLVIGAPNCAHNPPMGIGHGGMGQVSTATFMGLCLRWFVYWGNYNAQLLLAQNLTISESECHYSGFSRFKFCFLAVLWIFKNYLFHIHTVQ